MVVHVVAANARSVAALNKRVKSGAPNLLLFYATWCGHCQTLHPEWERLKDMVSGFALTMNELEHTTLAYIQKHDLAPYCNVAGYPTMVLFKDNGRAQYNGPRVAEAIRDWLQAQGVLNPKPKSAVKKRPRSAAAAKH